MGKTQKKRKKGRLRRIITVFLLLVIMLVSFCLFAPFFHITEIAVEGNAQVATEEILDRVNLALGTNIFKINKKSIRGSLETLAYLDTVRIKRKLPSTVRICVTECYAELMIPYTTGYLLTNCEGKVLEQISDNSGWELPQVIGLEIENAEISQKIAVQDGVKFDIILSCIQYFKENGQLEQMQQIDFSDITNISAIYREGFRVNFAKFDDMDYKMKMLNAILPQIDRSPGTYVDLTTPSKVFTGREETKPSPEPEKEETEVGSAEESAKPREKESPRPSEEPAMSSIPPSDDKSREQ